MTDNVEILLKGTCPGGAEGFVTAKNYILAAENGKKFLLAKLFNGMRCSVTAVTLYIEQFDASGDKIQADEMRVHVAICPGKSYAVEQKIYVSNNCADCRVTVLKAECDGYEYTADDEQPSYRFDDDPPVRSASANVQKRKLGKSGIKVTSRSLKMPILITVTSLIVFIAAFVAVLSFFGTFKADAKEFIHDGVRYEFVGGDKSDNSDIIAVGANGKQSVIVIPKRINNHKVTGIKNAAFENNKSIVSLKIYAGIDIDMNAFSGCSNLETVDIENVTGIGVMAFSGCGIKSVKLDKITKIDAMAFLSCSQLRSFVITESESGVFFDVGVLRNCNGLKTVDIGRDIDYVGEPNMFPACSYDRFRIKSFDYGASDSGISVLFDGTAVEINALQIDEVDEIGASFCKNVGVSSLTVKALISGRVGDSAFENSGIESLSLPSRITSVGDRAFYGCALASFDGSALEVMGKAAFASCKNLVTFDLGGNTALEYISEEAFSGCASLCGIYIPENVAAIGERAFYGCGAIYDVEFASGCELERIAPRVFSDCTALNRINIPESVKEIGSRAFYKCTALVNLLLPSGLEVIGPAAFAYSALVNAVIPESVVSVGRGILEGCSSLRSYTAPFVGLNAGSGNGFSALFRERATGTPVIPSELTSLTFTRVTSVSAGAFKDFVGIKTVAFPNGINVIGGSAFENCTALETVSIGTGIDLLSVGDRAFYGCSSIRSIEFPATLNSIGEKALYGCTALERLTVPFLGNMRGGRDRTMAYLVGDEPLASLKYVTVTDDYSIAEHAFSEYTALREVIYDCDIVTIGANAFFGCRRLNKFTLPSTVTQIGNDAFWGCYTLYEVHNDTDLPIVRGNADFGYVAFYALKVFDKTQSGESLPSDTIDGYKFVAADGKLYMVDYTAGDELVFPETASAGGVTGKYTILGYLFAYDDAITSVDMSDAVDAVGDYAFYGCFAMQTLVLSDHIATIGDYAFGDCISLTQAKLPSSLDRVPHGMFIHCQSLTDVEIPSAESIGDEAFYQCYALTTVAIPSECLSVGARAFYECVKLAAADLPAECTSIGDEAFYNCCMLADLDLPANCSFIGRHAFSYCSKIKRVELGKNLTAIGEGAFYECIKLIEVCNLTGQPIETFANSGITQYAEYFTTSATDRLENVIVNDLHYYKIAGEWWLVDYYGKSGVDVVVTADSFPYGGERVGAFKVRQYAFYNTAIGSFTSNAATELRGNAFYNTTVLSVDIDSPQGFVMNFNAMTGNGLTTLAIKAKGDVTINDSSLMNLDRPDVRISSGGNVVLKSNAFAGVISSLIVTCSNFTAESYAVNGGSVMTSLGIEATGDLRINDASIDCIIVSVSLKANFLSVPSEMFMNKHDLKYVYIDANNVNVFVESMFMYSAVEEAVIAGALTELPDGFFQGCNSLKSVTLPAGLTKIGTGAFGSCGALQEAVLPNGLREIGSGAFMVCGALEKINLPDGLVSIGDGAFQNCTSLKSITIPSSVRTLGSNVFYYCRSLVSVTVNSTVNISDYLFGECTSLASVVFVEGAERLGEGSFMNCYGLTTISIPSTVKNLGNSVFRGCSALSRVNIPSAVTVIPPYAFCECSALKSVSLSSTIRTIEVNAFTSSGLTSIDIPQGVTTIKDYAFAYCRKLAEVSLPSSLTSIGNSSFAYLGALKEINIPVGVKTVSVNAFSDCTALENVTLSDSLTRIESSAFYGCAALNYIVIPRNVTYVAGDAFNGCNILGICNKSRATVKTGMFVYNGCGRPLVVSAEESAAKPAFATAQSGNEYMYIGGKPYLYKTSGNNIVRNNILYMPDGETTQLGKTGNYTVLNGALDGVGNFNEMMLPKSVKAIENGAVNNYIPSVYYTGTADEFISRDYNLNYGFVMIYKKCLHDGDDGRWTFDARDNVSLEHTALSDWTVYKAATCTEKGEQRRTCPHCTVFYDSRVIDAFGHSYDDDGVCTRCKAVDPDVPVKPDARRNEVIFNDNKEREYA